MLNKDNAMLKKMKKRGIDLATEMRDPLAASQRRGKGRKSKATGILIAALIVLGGVIIGSPFSSQSNNSQNTPTPSSDPSPSYQQPTINKDFAVNYAQSDQLSVVNTTNIDNALAQHTAECSIDDALGHYLDLSPQCQVQRRLVISIVQNEIETIPALFEINEQLVLHHNNVDETVQFFLDRDKYPKMISIWINFGRFNTGGVIGGNGGLGGGRPGGGGGGGGRRSTLPFSPPPLNSEFQAQMDRLTDELQHGLAVGNPEVIDREVNRLANEWRDRMNELVDQQASLLAEYDDYHGPHYIHPNWEEHANEDNMRLALEPLYAQDRAEINELVDGLVEVEVEMAQREVDLLYGFVQNVVAYNQICLDLVHDLAQQTVAFNEVRYENPWIGIQVPVVDNVESLQAKLESKTGITPGGQVMFVCNGKRLEKGIALYDSGCISNGSTVQVSFLGHGGIGGSGGLKQAPEGDANEVETQRVRITQINGELQPLQVNSFYHCIENEGEGECGLYGFDQGLQLAFSDIRSYSPRELRSFIGPWGMADLDTTMANGLTFRENIENEQFESRRSAEDYLDYITNGYVQYHEDGEPIHGAHVTDLEFVPLANAFEVNVDIYHQVRPGQIQLRQSIQVNSNRPTISLMHSNNHWEAIVHVESSRGASGRIVQQEQGTANAAQQSFGRVREKSDRSNKVKFASDCEFSGDGSECTRRQSTRRSSRNSGGKKSNAGKSSTTRKPLSTTADESTNQNYGERRQSSRLKAKSTPSDKAAPRSRNSVAKKSNKGKSSMSIATDKEFDQKLENVKKTIHASLSSTELPEDEKIFNTKNRFVALSSDASMTEDQLGDLRFLANGYDQTNQPPHRYNPSLNTNCPVAMIHNGQEQFKLDMKELGIEADWNLVSIPYHYDAKGGKPLVCMMLHYQTTEEFKGMRLTETDGLYGHTARRRRSNGALASFTPSHLSHSVGHDNFNDACYLDIYPFAHPKGGSPFDVLTAQQVDKVMDSWNRNVLEPIHDHEQTVVALCSKETERLYAKHVIKGSVKDLNGVYLKNTNKFISAEKGKLVSGYHPSAMYDPRHWSNMGLKTRVMDTFMTNAKIAITSNPNVEKCTFSAGFLDTDSEFFKLMQARYLAGCSLGGKTTQEMRREAGYHYAILMEDDNTREQALDWIESELSAEHRALFLNEELFTTTSQLAARLGRDEVVSEEEFQATADELGVDVTKLRENAKAMKNNQDRFTAEARLASEMLVREVSDEEINNLADQLGMKSSKLRENAQSWIDNWDDQREAVSVYCAKTDELLENCISVDSASPNLYETVGFGLLQSWNDSNRGQDNYVSVEDIKNAGPSGLGVGNRGTLDEPQRIFTLKMSTGKEKITLSDKKRQKILNDGKNDHAAAGKRRKGNCATESLYMISKVDEEGDMVPVGKARNIADVFYNKSKNPDGLRQTYGSSTYFCGLQEGHKSEGHPEGHQTTVRGGRKMVYLNDAVILKEMKWQKDNNLEVVGFRDDGWTAKGGGKLVHHEDRECYIVILEKDEEGRSPQEQYDSLVNLTEMKKEKTKDEDRLALNRQKDRERKRRSRAREAESKTDKKDGTKKRKTSRRG